MKKIIGLFILFGFSFSSFASGIPTADLANLAQMTAEFEKQKEHWSEQIKQYKKDYEMFENQYKKAQQQYNAISGIRDLSGALDYLGAQNWTMDDLTSWLSDPNRILTAGFDALNADLKSRVTELGFADMCSYKNSEDSSDYQHKLSKSCEGTIVINLLESAKYEKAVKLRQTEDTAFLEKMKEFSETQDMKESTDNTNALLGILIQQQVKTQRMLEDQKSQERAKEAQSLKQEADYKAWLSQYDSKY